MYEILKKKEKYIFQLFKRNSVGNSSLIQRHEAVQFLKIQYIFAVAAVTLSGALLDGENMNETAHSSLWKRAELSVSNDIRLHTVT